MNEKPLYLREHSKKLLHESLFNDTLFLARHNVMDYSLLVGFDEEKHELVVGIVGMYQYKNTVCLFTRNIHRNCINIFKKKKKIRYYSNIYMG